MARLEMYSIHSKQNYDWHSLKKEMQIHGRPHIKLKKKL